MVLLAVRLFAYIRNNESQTVVYVSNMYFIYRLKLIYNRMCNNDLNANRNYPPTK